MKKVVQDLTSGGLLGVWGKWMKHAKYIYNIQDFNPEQVLAVGYTKSKLITDAMMWFDKFSCKRSDLVITVGRDLVETVENSFKDKKVPKTVMINNWIDENEIYPLDESNEKVLAFKKKYGLGGKFVIMYSGNIGLYYDLENLIKVVEKIKPGTKTADGREVVFAFVGAGSVLDKLVLYVKQHHMDNVTFIPYQDKADLIYSLNLPDSAPADRTVGSECADRGGIQKKPRKSEREMTTPLFLLRCVQLGISIADLDLLTIGLVNDMFTERQNDDYPYKELASQEDFDRF